MTSFFNLCFSFLLLLLFILSTVGEAQMKMQVISDEAVIYATADPNTTLTIEVRQGEVFEAQYYTEGWVVIQLFSGVDRYIESADVRYTGYELSYSIISSQKTRFCQELNEARQIAIAEARSEYPQQMDQQRGYANFLVDKLMLTVIRKFDIPAPEVKNEIECTVE